MNKGLSQYVLGISAEFVTPNRPEPSLQIGLEEGIAMPYQKSEERMKRI